MLHDRLGNVTRRAALALSAWLYLAAVGTGCSRKGQTPSGAAGIPDRLDKMRALRGSGDPRRGGERSLVRVRRESKPR